MTTLFNESLEQALQRNVRDALAEDIGRGDWTALLVPAGHRVTGRVMAKEAGVLCGQAWFNACVNALDADAVLTWHLPEGAHMKVGTEVCRIEADARALLSAERPALNFLQMLSGVATLITIRSNPVSGATAIRGRDAGQGWTATVVA